MWSRKSNFFFFSIVVVQSYSMKLAMGLINHTLIYKQRSLLQEFFHEVVDLPWSILLHPVTAVSNVPRKGKRERERERERGRQNQERKRREI